MTTNWDRIRTNYQLPNQYTYFESAYFGAMSDETIRKQIECLQNLQTRGSKYYDLTIEKTNEIRSKILEITNANHHNAALINDVSTPMSHLAHVFYNKKILLLDKDFPSVTAPWVGRRCQIQWMEREGMDYPIESIKEHLNTGVDVFAVSWVMFNSGLRLDIKAIGEMCKEKEIIFIVDATQGLGANPINLDEVHIDVLFATCYKWLLAGYGTGVAIATKDFEQKHDLLLAGHGSVLNGFEKVRDLKDYVTGIQRFELGHLKTQQIFALHSAIKELQDIGFDRIQERTQYLRDLLVEKVLKSGLKILTPKPMSNNILVIEGDEKLVAKLTSENIACTYRDGMIRFGTYFYNNEEDIDRLIKALN